MEGDWEKLLRNEMGSGREEICVRGSLGYKRGETEMRKVRRGISLPKVSGDKERGGSYLFHNLIAPQPIKSFKPMLFLYESIFFMSIRPSKVKFYL